MAEENNQGESGPLPPKLDLRKSGILKLPPQPTSKKETSRIPLDAARSRVDTPEPGAAKPAGLTPVSTVRISKPGETAQIPHTPMPVETSSAEKRKTSRISLEAVLGEAGAEERAGPPTIRLKRPGEPSGPTAKTVKGAAAAGKEDSSQTPTQRKTVVIRRGAGGAGPRRLSVARAAATGETAGEAEAELFAAEPQPHWIFGVLSIAAMLTIGVLIYVFCAEAIGPNSSQMQYSWWKEGPNLAWPGKISGN
jgi:hypothetical protein